MSAPLTSSTPGLPWSPRETRWVLAAAALCLVLLTVCWYRAAGQGRTGDQLPWLNAGAGGVALYWLLSGRILGRARRRVAARRAVQFTALARPRWAEPRATEATAPVDSVDLVIATGMARAHRSSCPLLAGKALHPAPADAPTCGICG
jgi:hypothetical protein